MLVVVLCGTEGGDAGAGAGTQRSEHRTLTTPANT